jgi:RNA ligase
MSRHIEDILNIKINDIWRSMFVDNGYISCRPHPDEHLFILNYTPQCQIEWYWTPETIACRGLIINEDGNVIARPFAKFFTLEQYKSIKDKMPALYGMDYSDLFKNSFKTYEKVDGSLGILYKRQDGSYDIATRGSFVSEQAQRATEILHQNYSDIQFNTDDYTYLFEIVYPENSTTIVNYGDTTDIILLDVLNIDTGHSCQDEIDRLRILAVPYVNEYYFNSVDDVLCFQEHNAEGFVLKFDNEIRVKVKFEEYLLWQRAAVDISPKRIWQKLHDGEPLYPPALPAHLVGKIKEIAQAFNEKYSIIQTEIDNFIATKIEPYIATKKDIAILYPDHPYKHIFFLYLDNKSYKQAIWKLLKP